MEISFSSPTPGGLGMIIPDWSFPVYVPLVTQFVDTVNITGTNAGLSQSVGADIEGS